MEANAKNLNFATWLRAFSMLLILACHYCAECGIPAVSMLGQVFNIGVQLFFILSGFLTGYKGIPRPYTAWYRKRAKRIYLPYWLFLTGLAGIHLAKGMKIFTVDWLLLWLGVQGSYVGVWGAGQTWFLSALLLCYLVSPAVLSVNRKLIQLNNQKITILSWMLVCALPLLYAAAEPEWVYTLLTPVSLYIMSCVYGEAYGKNGGYPRSGRHLLWGCVVIAAAFGTRFAARMLMDGTALYARIIVPYTHMIAASAIWVIFETLFAQRKVPKAVRRVSDLSFEIYLWHYMFVVGPISVFALVNNWIAACAATTLAVFAISLAGSRITAFLSKPLLKK